MEWRAHANGKGVSFSEHRNVSNLDYVIVAQFCEYTKTTAHFGVNIKFFID